MAGIFKEGKAIRFARVQNHLKNADFMLYSLALNNKFPLPIERSF